MLIRRLPLTAFLCMGAATIAAQSAPPLITLQVTTVQVTALDSHGQPVTDLQAADFRVADDGKPQPPYSAGFWRAARQAESRRHRSSRTNSPIGRAIPSRTPQSSCSIC